MAHIQAAPESARTSRPAVIPFDLIERETSHPPLPTVSLDSLRNMMAIKKPAKAIRDVWQCVRLLLAGQPGYVADKI